MINNVKTKKIVSKGCMGYMVTKIDELVPSLQDIVVVCEF